MLSCRHILKLPCFEKQRMNFQAPYSFQQRYFKYIAHITDTFLDM